MARLSSHSKRGRLVFKTQIPDSFPSPQPQHGTCLLVAWVSRAGSLRYWLTVLFSVETPINCLWNQANLGVLCMAAASGAAPHWHRMARTRLDIILGGFTFPCHSDLLPTHVPQSQTGRRSQGWGIKIKSHVSWGRVWWSVYRNKKQRKKIFGGALPFPSDV